MVTINQIKTALQGLRTVPETPLSDSDKTAIEAKINLFMDNILVGTDDENREDLNNVMKIWPLIVTYAYENKPAAVSKLGGAELKSIFDKVRKERLDLLPVTP